MAKTIKVKEIGELIGEESFDMNWFSYDLMGGWGSKLTKYSKPGAARGIIIPGIDNAVSFPKVYKKLKNGDFSEIAGFYVAILCFFGEKIYEKLDFVEKIPKNSVNTIVSTLQCPEHFKDKIYEICHAKYDFLSFISAAFKLEKTNFDEKSAIAVYKLQGDKAIYPLLCQMFYSNKGIDAQSSCLINDLNIQLPIKISNYLSGCTFPVAVSPKISATKWDFNDNGWFLYGKLGKKWLVMDCVGVGRFNLANYSLNNRLNYLGGGGECLPYVICWNWGEIIEAYHLFDQDLLIRDLKNTIFAHYWFNFGKKSLINVRFKENHINFDENLQVSPNFAPSLITLGKHRDAYLTIDLQGNFVNYCDKKDVFYSDSEVFDWFELGKML